MACFAHFTCQRLQPLPVRKLYDTVSLTASCLSLESNAKYSLAKEEQPNSSLLHSNPSSAMGTIMYVRSNSRTTAVFSVSQLALFSCPFRYVIIEDFGPSVSVRDDWPGFLVSALPQILGCLTVGIFSGALLVFIYLVGSFSYAIHSSYSGLLLANETGGH
jgi:hypothetical protein